MNCEKCKGKHSGNYGSGRFCSAKCARSFSNNSDKNKNESKIIKCFKCGCEVEVNKRTPKYKCIECKNTEKKRRIPCAHCGELKCLRKDICKKYRVFPTLIKYFGFNKNVLGTINLYQEWELTKNKLKEEYWDNELSLIDIKDKYKLKANSSCASLLSSLNIKRRPISNALTLAYKNGKLHYSTIPKNGKIKHCKYKHGWHKTWNNKKVFYRSSYELDHAKELDEQKIDYEMETLRILYWDSQALKQRVAIPDFYLPEFNTIVEIKSNYSYNKLNMIDKAHAYKKHGYEFKLILEHKKIAELV